MAAAEAVAARYDALPDASEETWARKGFRSNGSEFTVDSLARYHLHDVLHHSHDVHGTAARATVSAYDGNAVDYSDATWAMRRGQQRARLVRRRGGGRGVGAPDRQCRWSGRARARGPRLTVRRTDVTPAFVELMRSRGYDAEVLDPLTDEPRRTL